MSGWGPWSVLWVDFSPQVGREQAGRRPAIVVGSPLAVQIGARSGLVLVVPCTSTDRGHAWQPKIALGGKHGVAMCEQIRSISRRRVVGLHPEALSEQEIDEIRTVLHRLIA